MSTPRPLWDHQNESIDHIRCQVTQAARWASIVIPTSGGKTRILQGSIHHLLREETVRGVLVAVPMTHIEDAFVEDTSFVYTPDGEEPTQVDLLASSWTRIRDGVAGVNLRAFLADPRGVAITTQQQLVRLLRADLPADLTGVGLFIDEGHHNGEKETWLYDLAEAWHGCGGFVVTATATPFRTDGQHIAPVSVEAYTRSYMAIAEAVGLPRTIEFRTLALTTPAGERADDRLTDDDVARIATYIAKVGGPTLLRIQPGHSNEIAARFLEALVMAGIRRDRILNAVGEDGEPLRKALLAERKILATRGYRYRTLQVIIVCRRGGEGMDWPACHHVVSVGLSDAILPVVQLVGRGLRAKGAIRDYPPTWCDTVLFTAFVPEWPVGSTEEAAQVQRLLLFACALDCNEVAYDYLRYWSDLVTNFRLPPQHRGLRATLRRLGETDVETEANAKLIGLAAATELRRINGGRPAKLKDLIGCIRDWKGTVGVRVLKSLFDHIEDPDSAVRCAVKEQLTELIKDLGVRVDRGDFRPADLPEVYLDALHVRLLALAETYGELAVPIDVGIAKGCTGTLTPTRVRRILCDMVAARDAVFTLTDEEIITKVIEPYHRRYGSLPVLGRGVQDVSILLDPAYRCDLTDIDRCLRRSGLDLARLVLLAPAYRAPAVNVTVLRKVYTRPPQIDTSHYATVTDILRNRRDPRYNRDRRLAHNDLITLEICAQRGWRGLPGGQTARDVLAGR